MKLCIIAGSAAIHATRWANFFAERNHEVHVISPRLTEGYGEYSRGIRTYSLPRFFPRIWKASAYASGAAWLCQVRQLVNEIRPDVLNAIYISVPTYLAVASGFHPLALVAWGSDILHQPKQSRVRRVLTGYSLRKADWIVCPSDVLKEEAVELGADPGRVFVTPMGVDTRRFRPGESRSGHTVISTRSLKPIYDVETLVRAMPLVVEILPHVKFVILGDGEQRGSLERLSHELGISDSVSFLGQVPNSELPTYLASSDVYVSTSLSDGASIGLLEALACEVAPVVTDIPANRPWITDGVTGFLFPTGNHEVLAARIVQALGSGGVRSSRDMVLERGDWEREMSKVEEGLLRLSKQNLSRG